MKKKKIFKRILIALLLFVVIGSFITIYITGTTVFENSMQMVTNETATHEKTLNHIKNNGFDVQAFIEQYQFEQVSIPSTFESHQIPADYITIEGDRNKPTVVMAHGLGGDRAGVYPVAEFFLKNGFNVFAYDQRSSGCNTAPYTTFGYLESNDLTDCVNYIRSEIGENMIGVWGTSFGGATVGIFLGSDVANKEVSFGILDCPLSNMKSMLSRSMAQMGENVPVNFLLFCGNLTTKIRLGFDYTDADARNHICRTEVPVLIIGTKIDNVTPFEMAQELLNAVPHQKKKLFSVEDSRHAAVFYDHTQEYENAVLEFLRDYTTIQILSE